MKFVIHLEFWQLRFKIFMLTKTSIC